VPGGTATAARGRGGGCGACSVMTDLLYAPDGCSGGSRLVMLELLQRPIQEVIQGRGKGQKVRRHSPDRLHASIKQIPEAMHALNDGIAMWAQC
jgi:hypothetical protein